MPRPKIEIIYSNDDIFVINKPPGISVTKDRTGAKQLTDILTEQIGAETANKLRLIHRLDKDTSGVMMLALNKDSQSKFTSYFEKKLVSKTYLALVTGAVQGQKGTIDSPLAHSRKDVTRMCVSSKRGKEAITNWRLLADFSRIKLLAVQPVTGRTHQIRVHLPNIGLQLAIDPLYGSSRPLFLSDFKAGYRLGKEKIEKPLIERLTLHAYQIELLAPLPDCPECFIAGLDKKLAATIKMLAKHNPNGNDAFDNPDDFGKIIETEKLG